MSSFSPFLFCLCGPSGVGKTTISRELLKLDSLLILSVSSTTRLPREGEIEGVHYYFKSKDEFDTGVRNSEFLEWAEYNNHCYGTPKSNYNKAKESESDLLLDIEVQGAKKLSTLLGDKVKVIYIAPPSFDILRDRLVDRGSESEEVVKKRLKRAKDEIQILSGDTLTDYTVVNHSVEAAVSEVSRIIAEVRKSRK